MNLNRNTLWARFGPLSRWIGTAIQPHKPPILVLSLPRSGSSWVGETMGISKNAMYLREPINQSYLLERISDETVFEFDLERPPTAYLKAARDTFRKTQTQAQAKNQDGLFNRRRRPHLTG